MLENPPERAHGNGSTRGAKRRYSRPCSAIVEPHWRYDAKSNPTRLTCVLTKSMELKFGPAETD